MSDKDEREVEILAAYAQANPMWIARDYLRMKTALEFIVTRKYLSKGSFIKAAEAALRGEVE